MQLVFQALPCPQPRVHPALPAATCWQNRRTANMVIEQVTQQCFHFSPPLFQSKGSKGWKEHPTTHCYSLRGKKTVFILSLLSHKQKNTNGQLMRNHCKTLITRLFLVTLFEGPTPQEIMCKQRTEAKLVTLGTTRGQFSLFIFTKTK